MRSRGPRPPASILRPEAQGPGRGRKAQPKRLRSPLLGRLKELVAAAARKPPPARMRRPDKGSRTPALALGARRVVKDQGMDIPSKGRSLSRESACVWRRDIEYGRGV